MDAWKLFRTSRRIFFPTFSNFRLEQSGHVLIYRWCDVNNIVKFCDRSKYRVDTCRFTSREKRLMRSLSTATWTRWKTCHLCISYVKIFCPWSTERSLCDNVLRSPSNISYSPLFFFFFYIYPFPFRNFRSIPHHFSFSPDNNHRASRYHFFFVSFLLRALVKRNSATCCIIIIPPPLRIAEL